MREGRKGTQSEESKIYVTWNYMHWMKDVRFYLDRKSTRVL